MALAGSGFLQGDGGLLNQEAYLLVFCSAQWSCLCEGGAKLKRQGRAALPVGTHQILTQQVSEPAPRANPPSTSSMGLEGCQQEATDKAHFEGKQSARLFFILWVSRTSRAWSCL